MKDPMFNKQNNIDKKLTKIKTPGNHKPEFLSAPRRLTPILKYLPFLLALLIFGKH